MIYGGEYALYLTRRRAYAVGAAFAVIVVLLAFLPHVRAILWPLIAWAILIVSAIVVLGVGVSMVVAVMSMYTEYPATNALNRGSGATATMPSEIAVLQRFSVVGREAASRWADVLNNLRSAEVALSKLEGNMAFEAMSDDQKRECYEVHKQVQRLIREISGAAYPRRLVS